MEPRISFDEAKRLSIKKWEMLAKGEPYDNVKNDPELKELNSQCGFCERWDVDCEKCELGKIEPCLKPQSLFGRWSSLHIYKRPSALRIAAEMLERIKNLKEE